MTENTFKVLLFSDGTQQSFAAAVYTATFLKNMTNIQLTIVQLKETDGVSHELEYSWKELRPVYKRSYRGYSAGVDYCWKDSYPLSPDQDWKRRVFDNHELETCEYRQILWKTNEIFAQRGLNAENLILCTNTKTDDISDTADLIVDYAAKNSFDLIVMGELMNFKPKYLKYGDLAHSVQNKSPLPVVLVKKLSQEFIDRSLFERNKPLACESTPVYDEQASHVHF